MRARKRHVDYQRGNQGPTKVHRPENRPPICPPRFICFVNRRYLYCGHGRQRNRSFRLRTIAWGQCAPLGTPIDFDVRGLGRQLPRTEAPEGWIRKIERRREGRVWVGYFHLWTIDANGHRVRTKKEKTLGPASMPKHEAQQKLAQYIEEYTGRLTKQGSSITTFTELWTAFSAVKSGRWSKKMQEDLRYLFGKHVLPIVGNQAPRDVTLTSLQLLLNKMAEDGYCKSGSGKFAPTSRRASSTRRMKISSRRTQRASS